MRSPRTANHPRTDADARCAGCRETKPAAEFYSNRHLSSGLMSECRTCSSARSVAWERKNRVARAEYNREWRKSNPDKVRASKVKSTYGLDAAAHAAMRDAQGGCCAVCHEPLRGGRAECVDHNHASGRVRAILCAGCNKAIGHASENPAVLRALADYVEHWEGVMPR